MSRRQWIPVAGALLLALTGPAGAAAPVCNLVVDQAGDGRFGGIGAGTPAYGVVPNDPSLDIRSVDVATNPSGVAVAIRLAGYERLDALAPTGRMYVVVLTVAGHPDPIYFQYLERAAALPEARWGQLEKSIFVIRQPVLKGPARYALDPARAELRIWLPTAFYRLIRNPVYRTLVELGGRTRMVTLLEAGSFRWAGDPTGSSGRFPLPLGVQSTVTDGVNEGSDIALGAIRYVGSTPSCLPVGR